VAVLIDSTNQISYLRNKAREFLVVAAWYGDQHHPILSGDPVVAAFDRQNVLEI